MKYALTHTHPQHIYERTGAINFKLHSQLSCIGEYVYKCIHFNKKLIGFTFISLNLNGLMKMKRIFAQPK